MRLLEFFQRIDMTRLDELIIRYRTRGEHDDYNLIAHRENIWLWTRDDDENSRLIRDVQERTGLRGYDMEQIKQAGRDRGDVITAVYKPNEYTLWYEGNPAYMTHNPAVSKPFKKLVDFLKIEYVNGMRLAGSEDTDVEHHRSEIKGEIPNELWHGTNSKAIYGIMKLGIVPGEGEGNWENVGQFHDIVFLSEDFYNARFHAERQAHNKNSAPIILQVKIPDRSKIVPDYDMALAMNNNPEMMDKLGYSGTHEYYDEFVAAKRQEVTKYNPGSDLTMISGIVGYQGRIPANHIISIVANLAGEMGDPDDPQYTEFSSWKEFGDALNIYNDYGYWYEGIEDEMEDLEDEEDEEDVD